MKRVLSPKTKELLDGSDEEKIAYVYEDRWIAYSAADNAVKKMNDLIKIPNTHRPRNILLLGSTNNGKTVILNRFEKENPRFFIEGRDHYDVPCLKIQASYKPSPKMLYIKILDAIMFPHRPQQSLEIKEQQAFSALRTINNKVLIIDEIHHALIGSANQQREFVNCLKHLSNELRISIVAAGTMDAFYVINSDPQMANRFNPITLEKWKYNDEFLSLLYTFEALLPLENSSNLFEENKAKYILALSEGLIGEIVTILRESFLFCLENNIKSITMDVLKNINYAPPSMRRKLSVII